MASRVRRPSPGMANTLSVTTAPPISSAMPMPMTVTIGTEAFFSACRNRIGLCPSPLARAKGLGQSPILFLHALKNASVPIVTVIGIGIALLIGGAVVTESVFAIPGLGRLTLDAILRRDYPVIQGIVLLFSFLYVLVNLMVDVVYTLVDPRIRY